MREVRTEDGTVIRTFETLEVIRDTETGLLFIVDIMAGKRKGSGDDAGRIY